MISTFRHAFDHVDILKHWTTGHEEYAKEFSFLVTSAEIEVGSDRQWRPLPLEYPLQIFVLFRFYIVEGGEEPQIIALNERTIVRSPLFNDATLCRVEKKREGEEVKLLVDAGSNCHFRFLGRPQKRNPSVTRWI